MGDSAAGAPSEGGEPSDDATTDGRQIVVISESGDLILDVTFETSKETLKRERKASLAAARKAGATGPQSSPQALRPSVSVAYRVNLDALTSQSKYFSNLLSHPQFAEAIKIRKAHEALAASGIKPGEAHARYLPWVSITDDDEATAAAGRETTFEDLLRIIHQKPMATTKVTMHFVSTLVITADRFDCTQVVSRALNADTKYKWPVTSNKSLQSEDSQPTETEKILRQKVLVSWLLGQPMRLHHCTREIILRGSSLWGAFRNEEVDLIAAWWNLPDGLERELQFRRECILNTIASIQRHFLNLYTSKERQCKLGYDSSAACDSFQLGQMLKFFVSKGLLFPVDFGPSSLDTVPDMGMVDVEELLTTLKQCPNYQIDKFHTNCGLRIRIDPILDYIRAMLATHVVSIPCAEWKKHWEEISWAEPVDKEVNSKDEDGKGEFAFTRATSNDQRLRYEGNLFAKQMARKLFTASSWDWTPEM